MEVYDTVPVGSVCDQLMTPGVGIYIYEINDCRLWVLCLISKQVTGMLPPAHKVVAQACDSTGSPEHVPPFSECVVISLARN